MAADKRQPDPLVIVANGGTIIAPGSALARLQTVAEDPEAELLVGDLKDTLAYTKSVIESLRLKIPRAVGDVGSRLEAKIKDKLKGETVVADPADVATLTAFLLKPAPEPEEPAAAPAVAKSSKPSTFSAPVPAHSAPEGADKSK